MKYVFIGGLYATDYQKELLQNCVTGEASIPSNVYQWEIVKGLIANGQDVKIISYPFLPGYPRGYRRPFSPESPIVFDGKLIGEMKRYCTFFLTKDFSVYWRLKKSLKELFFTEYINRDETINIITYSPYASFICAILALRRKYSNIRTCCIITDLFYHEFSQLKGLPCFKKIQNGLEVIGAKKALPQIDKYVVLAKKMEEIVPTIIGRNIVIEGIANPQTFVKKEDADQEIKTVLYTGSLGRHTSIKELVCAFMQISNENYRLCICGTGEYKTFIEECAEKDNRIVYRGVVDHETAVSLQRDSTILINPRFPSIKDTPYSFPSKTMEYLSSGTPMIGFRLEGIPEEYYEHIYCVPEESVTSLANTINSVLSKSQKELNEKARKAYDFVMLEKTAKKQAEKLINFLNSTL